MKDWVNRTCLLSGVFTAFLLPCSAEIVAAEMAIRIAEEAQYKDAHKLLAQIRSEGTVILEGGEVIGNSFEVSLDIEVAKRVVETVKERPKLQGLLAEDAIKRDEYRGLTETQRQIESEKLSARIFSLLQKQDQGQEQEEKRDALSSEKSGKKVLAVKTIFRPARLDAVPMEFFVRYTYRPDLSIFIRLQKLLAIEQHIRNFHEDKTVSLNPDGEAVYQRGFTQKTISRMRNRLLNHYMIYQLHLYSAILHQQMDAAGEAIPTEALTEEEWRSLVTSGGVSESESEATTKKVPQVWGMGVEIHIRRAQYALWALQALSEMKYPLSRGGSRLMPYNLAVFGITHAEIKQLLDISGKELLLASIAFAKECQEGRRLITDQQFMKIFRPYMDNRTHFLQHFWRIDAKEIEAE